MGQGRNTFAKDVEEDEESIMYKIKPRWMPVFHDHDSNDDIFSPRLSKGRQLPRPSRPRVSRSSNAKKTRASRSKVSQNYSQEKKTNEKEKKKKNKATH